MSPGDAFLLNIPDSHIHFVAHRVEAEGQTPQIILLNFSTHRPGKCDETCIITKAEYAVLKHDSIIAYQYGIIVEGDDIALLRSRISRPLTGIGDATLDKIKRLALTSRFTPRKIKKLLAPNA